MRVTAFVQARLGSSRLPNKVLLDLDGKTVLERVLERVSAAKTVGEVVVVTTFGRNDLAIVKLCSSLGYRVFCGSENDVLDRFYQAARLLETDSIVRITADCPLMDPFVVDLVVERHFSEDGDYTSNVLVPRYPDGEDVEVFRFAALREAWERAEMTSEREHVTPYIKNHPESFKVVSIEGEKDLSKERWTLDTQEDYEFIRSVYDGIGGGKIFGIRDVMEFLRTNPNLREKNSHYLRNEGYEKSLKEDKRAAKA